MQSVFLCDVKVLIQAKMTSRLVTEKALNIIRSLPRVSLANLRDNPGSRRTQKRGRGQHGGDKHGMGQTRLNFMRLGYETGNNPFYLRFPREMYYKGHHLRRQYPPLSLEQLQLYIDTDRLDPAQPIDLAAICKTGLYQFSPDLRHFGVQLTDEGAHLFKAKVNIEVQWAPEQVIAAIESNGGVITTAYYDPRSLFILKNPKQFFLRGEAIPRRMIPPADAIEYYIDPANRGYLADPEKVSQERLVLSQKYGYELLKIEQDSCYDMLSARKDPRQIFYGLEPGWLVSLKDSCILKPKDEKLRQFYVS